MSSAGGGSAGGNDGTGESTGGGGGGTLDLVRNAARDLATDPSALLQVPCFTRALLWGGGVAGILAAHRFHASRSFARSLDNAVLGFLAGSGLSWGACRYERAQRQAKLEEAVEKMKEIQRRTAAKKSRE